MNESDAGGGDSDAGAVGATNSMTKNEILSDNTDGQKESVDHKLETDCGVSRLCILCAPAFRVGE